MESSSSIFLFISTLYLIVLGMPTSHVSANMVCNTVSDCKQYTCHVGTKACYQGICGCFGEDSSPRFDSGKLASEEEKSPVFQAENLASKGEKREYEELRLACTSANDCKTIVCPEGIRYCANGLCSCLVKPTPRSEVTKGTNMMRCRRPNDCDDNLCFPGNGIKTCSMGYCGCWRESGPKLGPILVSKCHGPRDCKGYPCDPLRQRGVCRPDGYGCMCVSRFI